MQWEGYRLWGSELSPHLLPSSVLAFLGTWMSALSALSSCHLSGVPTLQGWGEARLGECPPNVGLERNRIFFVASRRNKP